MRESFSRRPARTVRDGRLQVEFGRGFGAHEIRQFRFEQRIDAAGVDDEFSALRIGLDHLSLAVESREELERWLEHLDACGVPHSGASEMPYGWVVVFRDPDNIQLELLAAGPDFRLA